MTDSLLGAFYEAVSKNGPRTALVEGDGRHISFSDLAARSEAFASAWGARGLGRGDRVLLAMPVSADLYAALAAIWSLGATAVLPEPAMGLTGVRHALLATKCKGLVASGIYTWLRFLMPALWGKPLYRPTNGRGSAPRVDVSPDDIALISFTSGSTGVPKAIPRSHGFLQAQRRAVSPLLESDADDIDLVAFPVFVLINLAAGRCSVLPNWPMNKLDRVEAQSLAQWINDQSVTRALLPPVLVQALARSEARYDLNAIFTGGGPVFPDVLQRLKDVKPNMRVVAVYGSTEAEPIAEIDLSDISEHDFAAMQAGDGLLTGHPVAGLQLRLEEGEILVAGPHVNPGYLDPAHDQTTKVRVNDTVWHRTGDAGRLDQYGRVWLLGRQGQDVHGLHPFSIETAARTWPGVRAAALVDMRGSPVLAIEGEERHLDEWKRKAAAFETVIVKSIDAIPMDRRHRSKVDFASLKTKL